MTDPIRKIVIIGGGLSGLSAAFYVRKYYRNAGINTDIVLLEKEKKLGGKIETLYRDGLVIEKGPDSFLASKTEMSDLAIELKLDHELVTVNPKAQKTYIVQRDKLHPTPTGLVLGIPTEIKPFLKSGLISFSGKIRTLMDFILPARRSIDDESLGELIERRLGTEVLENMTEPLLAWIYAGDMHEISMNATYPHLGAIERQHGSLIRGITSESNSFLTFRKGLQNLVHSLIHELHDVEQRTETTAFAIIDRNHNKNVDHFLSGYATPRYEVELDNGERLPADDIFITTPNFTAADLLRPHVDVTALDAVNYVSTATVNLVFNKKDIVSDHEKSSFFVPRKEGRNITACTWTSNKWPHTCPDDKVLLRCYVGRLGDEQNVELPDEALIELVCKDLREIIEINVRPILTEITRFKDSVPQYPVEHPSNISEFRRELEMKLPRVYAFGAGYDGIDMSDCIKQAKIYAERAAKTL